MTYDSFKNFFLVYMRLGLNLDVHISKSADCLILPSKGDPDDDGKPRPATTFGMYFETGDNLYEERIKIYDVLEEVNYPSGISDCIYDYFVMYSPANSKITIGNVNWVKRHIKEMGYEVKYDDNRNEKYCMINPLYKGGDRLLSDGKLAYFRGFMMPNGIF